MHRPTDFKSSIINHQSSIARYLCLLCGGAMAGWSVGTADARAALPSHPAAVTPAPGSSSPAAGFDPCVPSGSTMQTGAVATAPAHNLLLASLMARARSRETAVAADPHRMDLLALDLWSSRISPPADGVDAETSQTLQQLIRQVHRLTLTETAPVPPSALAKATTEPAAPAPPGAGAKAEPAEPPPAPSTAAATVETGEALSAQARKTLQDLQRHPGRLRDPLETAELLFLSGRPTEAVPFYEEALRRTGAGATASAADQAWILFQLGNCLRETDVAKAQDAYARLLAEYPDSPWAQMAQASGQFLAWYQNARLDQLLADRPH